MPSAFSHDPSITVPGSSTDNAIAIFDGTGGSGFGNSTILVDSGGNGRIGIAGDTDVIIVTANTVTVAGTVAATTLTGAGSGITALAAGNIASGTVATARLGSGTANNTVFLRGDNTWAAPSSGVSFSGSTADGLVSYGSSSSAIVEPSLTFSNGQILILDNNDFDNACVLFKDTHSNFTGTGLTSLPDAGTIDTDTWLAIRKTDGPGGGVLLGSYAKAANTYSFYLEAMAGATNTAASNAGTGPIILKASRHNGSNALSGWTLDTYGESRNTDISNLLVLRRPAQSSPSPGPTSESGDQTVFAVDARGGIFTSGNIMYHDTEGPAGGNNTPNASNFITNRCTNTRNVPSSSSSNIWQGEDTGNLVFVFGRSTSPDTNRFADIVSFGANASVTTISSSSVRGSPASRTYGVNGYNLTLQMGTDTYDIMCLGWGTHLIW